MGTIILVVIMIRYLGIKGLINLMYQIMGIFNIVSMGVANTSVLSYIFKYPITYILVGLILVLIFKNKNRSIGKILYLIISIPVGIVLDYISKLIFK